MKDKELKLDEIEASLTLGGASLGNSKKVRPLMYMQQCIVQDHPSLTFGLLLLTNSIWKTTRLHHVDNVALKNQRWDHI